MANSGERTDDGGDEFVEGEDGGCRKTGQDDDWSSAFDCETDGFAWLEGYAVGEDTGVFEFRDDAIANVTVAF